MTDNVMPFTGLTTQPISVEQVLDGAKDHKRVVVVGIDEDGLLTIASSDGDAQSDFMLLHRAAQRIMEMLPDDC